jgi:hypothetical protein
MMMAAVLVMVLKHFGAIVEAFKPVIAQVI